MRTLLRIAIRNTLVVSHCNHAKRANSKKLQFTGFQLPWGGFNEILWYQETPHLCLAASWFGSTAAAIAADSKWEITPTYSLGELLPQGSHLEMGHSHSR